MPKIIKFSKNIATTMQIQEWAVMKMKTGIMMMRVIEETAVLAVLAVIVAMVIQPTAAIRAVAMMTAVASTRVSSVSSSSDIGENSNSGRYLFFK